jgi:RimJ/RimL family protein N-acetyltransferase
VKPPVAQNREMRLVDGDLELRPWEAGDLALVREAAQDAYIAEIEHIDDPATWLEEARRGKSLAIVVDGEPVGGIDVGSWHPQRGALGYFVIERHRGRGIATRAAQLLLRWALTEAHVIYGDRVGDAYLYAAVRGDF